MYFDHGGDLETDLLASQLVDGVFGCGDEESDGEEEEDEDEDESESESGRGEYSEIVERMLGSDDEVEPGIACDLSDDAEFLRVLPVSNALLSRIGAGEEAESELRQVEEAAEEQLAGEPASGSGADVRVDDGDEHSAFDRTYYECMHNASRTNDTSQAFLANNTGYNAPYIPEGILRASKSRAWRMRADGFEPSASCSLCYFMCIPRQEYIHVPPVVMTILSRFYETRFHSKHAFLEWATKFWNETLQKCMPEAVYSLYVVTYSQAEHHFYTCMRDGAQRLHDTLERMEAFEHVLTNNALQQEVQAQHLTGTIMVHADNMRHLNNIWKLKPVYVAQQSMLALQAKIMACATLGRVPLTPEDAKGTSQSAVFNKLAVRMCAQKQDQCGAM